MIKTTPFEMVFIIRDNMTQDPKRNETATVAQTVAEKFTQLPDRDKAYFVGYLMGKEAERNNEEDSRSA